MAINYELLGKRIAALRIRCHLSQEALGEILHIGRTHIAFIETNRRRPSIDLIVDIANALHVSTDDLLLDSLEFSSSTANTQLHRLLLECTDAETDIIIRNAENLKALLYSHSVK